MNFIKKIGLTLSDELKQRYPLDEVQGAPVFDPAKESSRFYSIVAIRGSKALFSINIGDEEISVTVHQDQPDYQNFGDIDGLPGVAIGVLLSKDSETHRFILAEPNCIEDVLSVIDAVHPQKTE